MPKILVGTAEGCRVITEDGETSVELAGHSVSALTSTPSGEHAAIINGYEIHLRSRSGAWAKIASVNIALQSLVCMDEGFFCGGNDQPAVLRIDQNGRYERLESFELTSGHEEWVGNGPPLGVRSLTITIDRKVILAAVHVGGIPRSEDGGLTWEPTIPIMYDVHEVCVHPTRPNVVAAATTVGLCVSSDAGRSWRVLAGGLGITNSLACAMLEDEVLFGICDGPFAKQSQLWRWRIDSERLEQVRDGLPDWLDGKIDTTQIGTGCGRAAVASGDSLWFSAQGSRGWKQIASGLPYVMGLAIS